MWSALKGAHGLGGVQEGFCQLHEMSGAWGVGGAMGGPAKGAWISPLTYISQPILSGLRKTDQKLSTQTSYQAKQTWPDGTWNAASLRVA